MRRLPIRAAMMVSLAATACAAQPATQPAAGTAEDRKLTREILERSLAAGTEFLVQAQQPAGNFIYELNFRNGELPEGDNQVRQAGALWSLALIHQYQPSEKVRGAVARGLDFFKRSSRLVRPGARLIAYPGDAAGRTGTMALVILSLVDFLLSEGAIEGREAYRKDLEEYIGFLLSLRLPGGQFQQQYDPQSGAGVGGPSPYYDGEALLALARAAKYAGTSSLKDGILESARRMRLAHVVEALAEHPDSNTTKGFFQWGVMAYHELVTSGWEGGLDFAPTVIELGRWMIDVHRTLSRPLNTAYAQEGLISAYDVARITGDAGAQARFRQVIDVGLYKLTSWQVGGPLAHENSYLQRYPQYVARARGGVMNSKADPKLRVDVTQHQMHAVILALRFLY